MEETCHNHPEVSPLGICTYCGRPLCKDCLEMNPPPYYCKDDDDCYSYLRNEYLSEDKTFRLEKSLKPESQLFYGLPRRIETKKQLRRLKKGDYLPYEAVILSLILFSLFIPILSFMSYSSYVSHSYGWSGGLTVGLLSELVALLIVIAAAVNYVQVNSSRVGPTLCPFCKESWYLSNKNPWIRCPSCTNLILLGSSLKNKIRIIPCTYCGREIGISDDVTEFTCDDCSVSYKRDQQGQFKQLNVERTSCTCGNSVPIESIFCSNCGQEMRKDLFLSAILKSNHWFRYQNRYQRMSQIGRFHYVRGIMGAIEKVQSSSEANEEEIKQLIKNQEFLIHSLEDSIIEVAKDSNKMEVVTEWMAVISHTYARDLRTFAEVIKRESDFDHCSIITRIGTLSTMFWLLDRNIREVFLSHGNIPSWTVPRRLPITRKSLLSRDFFANVLLEEVSYLDRTLPVKFRTQEAAADLLLPKNDPSIG